MLKKLLIMPRDLLFKKISLHQKLSELWNFLRFGKKELGLPKLTE